MEKLLQQLVAYRTVTGNFAETNRALDFIEGYLAERGMFIERRDYDGFGALVATTRRTKTPTVMLCGHIDVVEAADELFTMCKHDGKVYGRGVRDMKSAIASYLHVVDQLKDHLSAYDFGIQITSDEENRCKCVQELLAEGFRPKVAILPDGDQNWQLESSNKGTWFVSISVTGKTEHGARPWLGESASFKLLELLGEIKALFPVHGPETNTLNIGHFKSGTTFNQVPDLAQAQLDIRSINKAEQDRLTKKILALCDKYHAATKTFILLPPVVHDLQNPYMQTLIGVIADITGVTDQPGVVSHAGSEAIFFARQHIPCAVFYPTGGGHHSAEEWIDENVLDQFPRIIQGYLDRVAKVPTPAVDAKPALV